MSAFSDWPHKWFGYWRPADGPDSWAPLMATFVDSGFHYDDLQKVAEYLRSGRLVMSAGSTDVCPISNCGGTLLLGAITDGEWFWPRSLEHDLLVHNVRLPDRMLKTIIRNNYDAAAGGVFTDSFTNDSLLDLDWPFVPSPIAKQRRERDEARERAKLA